MFVRITILLTAAFAAFISIGAPAIPAADEAVPLRAGDRIIFLGDSITQAGAGPKGYVTLIREALREKHKDLNLDVLGAGISGNKVPDLQRRVDRDVIARKPTVVVIYIGINDVWHGENDPARGTPTDKFEAGLSDIIGKLHAKDPARRRLLNKQSVDCLLNQKPRLMTP